MKFKFIWKFFKEGKIIETKRTVVAWVWDWEWGLTISRHDGTFWSDGNIIGDGWKYINVLRPIKLYT